MHLWLVWRKALYLCTLLAQAQQGQDGFMNFRTVVYTTAGQNHCYFLAHFLLLTHSCLQMLCFVGAVSATTGGCPGPGLIATEAARTVDSTAICTRLGCNLDYASLATPCRDWSPLK